MPGEDLFFEELIASSSSWRKKGLSVQAKELEGRLRPSALLTKESY